MARHFMYRSDYLEGRIFETEELPKAEADGWVDAPGKVAKSPAQTEKDELEKFARERLGVKLDKRRSLPRLRAEVEGLMNGYAE